MFLKVIKNVMEDRFEERVTEVENEFAKSFTERMGKVIIVGMATIAVSMLVESQYDKYMDRRRERDENV